MEEFSFEKVFMNSLADDLYKFSSRIYSSKTSKERSQHLIEGRKVLRQYLPRIKDKKNKLISIKERIQNLEIVLYQGKTYSYLLSSLNLFFSINRFESKKYSSHILDFMGSYFERKDLDRSEITFQDFQEKFPYHNP